MACAVFFQKQSDYWILFIFIFYFNIPFPCLKGCIYLFFSQLLYQISLILFLLCSPFALFFSFLDFSPFLLLFVFCFFLHNFNEKHFFSSTILERFSNAYIILLQGRSQELLRTGSFGKLEDKFLESFWDKIAWKHPNDFSKYNYPDIQFTDKGNHQKPKYFYHEKFFCYSLC